MQTKIGVSALLLLAVNTVIAHDVEQDKLSTVSTSASYQNGRLTIPRVDTAEQIGKYVDVNLSAQPDGKWKLESFKEAGPNIALAPVDRVELLSVASLPKQVFLKVSGEFNGCSHLGQSYVRLEKDTFKVVVNDGFDWALAPLVSCIAAIIPYETTVALPVFGLKAGSYKYIVNGKKSGSFSLAVDNNLPPPLSVACTMDAKICPDGSAVGRVAPNCEFAACPGK